MVVFVAVCPYIVKGVNNNSEEEMENLITNIYDVIKDYRADDNIMSKERIEKWIEQFDEADQKFILRELLHLLKERRCYYSKDRIIKLNRKEIEALAEGLKYGSAKELLDESHFLSCQDDYKSQSELLVLTDDIIQKQFNISVEECGSIGVKNWIYIDDVLASGGTFKKDVLNLVKNKNFLNSDVSIHAIFYVIHEWGCKNCLFSLREKLKEKFDEEKADNIIKRIKIYRFSQIENHPRINQYNPNPAFNHVYPQSSKDGEKFLELLETRLNLSYPMGNEEFAFRPKNYPKKETFFTSAANRNRYEQIILKKGIEILERADSWGKSTRPLGFTPPSYKTCNYSAPPNSVLN